MRALAPLLTAAALALSAGTASAGDFLALNGLRVVPAGGQEFHVAFGGLTGNDDFWCAAGDFVLRGLGLPPSTRIYRTSPPPRRAGEGVDFSLSDARAADSGFTRFGARDKGMSAAAAQHFCPLVPFFPFN
ncbi:hypothetical protein [Paenirhodobacter hankyongi]|uniref:hypothetical protein n=1 Tax=Paenirhodobacter hankyongi TaxID=2294033 RepID=UPI0011C41798|nr:hypothetical protein [Sinirhodobacter hankyongi]